MMIKNKIIDKLVKKLIVNNFKKEDIFELIDINKCFNFFENYIYYLLLLSQKKYDDLKVKMCSTISSYLNYLVDTYKIKQLSITQFKQKSCISNYELYALGVKGYDGDKNFYFDLEENLYICLDNVKHLNYKGIINIKYNPNFLASKTNAKIINKNFNNIYVFEKSGTTNIYLGKYKFLFNTWLYSGNFEWQSFAICKQDFYDYNIIDEFDNLLINMQRESVNSFKQELINILIKNNYDSSKIIDNLSRATCHMTLIDAFVQICLLNKYRVVLENAYKNYKEMFDRQLNASELIPFVSSVNEYQLVLLSNSFDILKGNQIVSDYLNNIFICNDNINVEQGGIISCRFIKSFKNYFFDLNINKKIFFTNKSGSCIYIFKKQKGRYLFTGIYKCFKLTIGNDLKGNPTPIFKFHTIDNNGYVNHINYLRQLTVSNGYKNVFNDVINKNEDLWKWSKSSEDCEITETSIKLEHLNSLLFKYNWITKRCLDSVSDEVAFKKNVKLYEDFDNKNVNMLFDVVSNNFMKLVENKILKPHTIAYEMTKNNWANKELFDISYIDHYQTNQYKYELLLQIILSKRLK